MIVNFIWKTMKYISNLANIYLYTTKSDNWYYFKQGSDVKRFNSIRNEDKIKISIKSQRFNSKNKSVFQLFIRANIDIVMSLDEYEDINSKFNVLLFKDEKEIQEGKNIEDGFLDCKFYGEKFIYDERKRFS